MKTLDNHSGFVGQRSHIILSKEILNIGDIGKNIVEKVHYCDAHFRVANQGSAQTHSFYSQSNHLADFGGRSIIS